jgi:CheY-like chemotaxis protein
VRTVRAGMAAPARILVVDDDADIRGAISELLAEEGYEVVCAGNGEEALAQLAAPLAPSAILLDLTMPVMDGWTFRRRQRMDPRLAAIPTVVISATLPDDARAGGVLGAAAVLPKPFDAERLVETLQRIC